MEQAIAAEAFRIAVPEATLADLRLRLGSTRWPAEPEGSAWRLGANLGYMQQFVARWRDAYDWRAEEAALNGLPQYRAEVGGLKIHFLYCPGVGPNPKPLLLTHGWPGSVFEFRDIVLPLADPAHFGGDAADAFTVIAPSLPGYGFSAPPAAPVTPAEIADLWHLLMSGVLGFPRYFAHGGDWGSVVTSELARRHGDAVTAIHLTMLGLRPSLGEGAPPLSEAERNWVKLTRERLRREGGYQEIQGTRPQSLAYGLTDSPAGLAAWIVEKYHGWPGAKADQPPPFAMDRLITQVMLYWLNGINAPNWLYWAVRNRGGLTLKPGERVEVPTGVAFFPFDLFPVPPAEWVARIYNVVDRRDFDRGGHFVAMENGPLLVEELRRFFRAFRDRS